MGGINLSPQAWPSPVALAGDPLEHIDIEVGDLLDPVSGESGYLRFWLVLLPRVCELRVVALLAVILPHELLAQFNELAFGVFAPVPPSVLVRGPECVDDHEFPVLIEGELLLAVNVDEVALLDLLRNLLVNVDGRADDSLVLQGADGSHLHGLRLGEQPVVLLELRRHLYEWLRKLVAVLDLLRTLQPKLGGFDLPALDPVPEGASDIVSAYDFERHEVVRGLLRELRWLDDLDLVDPHPVRWDELSEVCSDAARTRNLE